MAETLVGLGAPLHLHSNPCGRGTHGTPLELARGGGHHAIAKMLECNGGVEPVAVGGGVARQEMDRGGGGGSMSPDLLNGCWVASVCPIPFIWAIYHNQKVTDDRVRGEQASVGIARRPQRHEQFPRRQRLRLLFGHPDPLR